MSRNFHKNRKFLIQVVFHVKIQTIKKHIHEKY